MIHSGG